MRESKKNSRNKNKSKKKDNELKENGEIIKEGNEIIKEEKLDTIEKEINDNKNKGNEKNQKKYKEAFKNIAVGCAIIAYFSLLLFEKGKISNIDYIKTLKVVILIDLVVSIGLLEYAFKKDKFSIGLHGIEMIFTSGFTVFILELFSKENQSLNKWFAIIFGIVALYYIAKSIIIVIKKQKS